MAKRPLVASSSARGSTVGRWMMSMGVAAPAVGLLGVELDDELLAHRYVDVLAHRDVAHGDLEAVAGAIDPCRDLAVDGVEVVADDDEGARLLVQRDHVALAYPEARDRDALAVHGDVAVADELAGLGPAGAPTGAV